MFPLHQLVGTPTTPTFMHFSMFGERLICNDVCTLVIVLVHLKAVFIFLSAECGNVFFILFFFFFFLRWARKQLPEVLSKLPVREVRGYL